MAVLTTTYDSTTDTNALTITLASLATSSTETAGRESTAVSNASNLFLDVHVYGRITTGTSPTGGGIAVWIYAPTKIVSSTVTYPVATATALTGSDAAATFEEGQRNGLRLGAYISVNTTSDRAYSIPRFSIAALYGGFMPQRWGVWVTHSTGVNLNATSGNHWIHYTGFKTTST